MRPATLFAWAALPLVALPGPAFAAPAAPVMPSAPPPATAAPAGPAAAYEGELPAATFDAAIARGPQPVVAGVEVEPALEKGRFRGFRLIRLRPDGLFAECEALRPGDVVVAVNRESIERPEQFMRAWDLVRGARQIEVEIRRDGQPMLLRWRVVP